MKKRDIILIGSILIASLASMLIILCFRKNGLYVSVKADGEEVARYPLSLDAVYELNGGTNILVIEGGKAYLKDATCPDKLCVRQGTICKVGEVITCLPNKLTVTVIGSDNNEIDFVS